MPNSHDEHNARLEALSRYVRDKRTQRGFTLLEVQKRGGPAPSLVSDIETGRKLEIPKPSTLEKLARGLGVPVPEIMAVAGLLHYGSSGTKVPNAGADLGSSETRKPWPLHDLSQTSAEKQTKGSSFTVGEDLSKAAYDAKAGDILDTRTGDSGQIRYFPADLGPILRLPVFHVSCGEPIYINESPDDYQTWPLLITGDADGILKVTGTSMLGCGFNPGDLLFFKATNGRKPQHGDKVVADILGDGPDKGAVCKIYQQTHDGEFLVSAPGEGVVFFRRIDDSVRLVGIVKGRYTRE